MEGELTLTDSDSRGPSPWQPWIIKTVQALMPLETLNLRLLPDDSQQSWYGVLDIPRLVRGGNQHPKFSLTLILARAPYPHEASIRPLIVSGYLGMEISYALPVPVRQETGLLPLYGRQASLTLHSASGSPLQEVALSTPLLRGALHTHLNQEDVLSVLDALDRKPSALQLKATIDFRAAAPGHSIATELRSVELWDLLQAESLGGQVTEAGVRRVFNQLVARGAIVLPEEVEAEGVEEDVFALFFEACQVFLTQGTEGDLLGDRPSPFSQPFERRWHSSTLRHLALNCTLDQIIGGALDGLNREAFIRVVGPAGAINTATGLSPLQRVRSSVARAGGKETMAVMGGRLQTVAATLQPAAAAYPTAHLLATETIRPAVTAASVSTATTYLTHNAVFYDTVLANMANIKLASTPVVIDVNTPLFRDEVSEIHRWYLPSVQLVTPAANASAEASPFLFELERTGAMASGRPALQARLRFTLELGMSVSTAAELKRLTGVQARPIELLEPSVALTVPYIDEADGQLKRASYRGVLTRTGNRLNVTIELLNDAVRTTYGSLSTTGFQAEAAQLELSYQFQCLAPVVERPELSYGGKLAMTHIVGATRDLNGERITVRSGQQDITFLVEPQGVSRSQAVALSMSPHLTVAQPPLALSHAALTLPQKVNYAQRTMIRQERIPAFFSCETFGVLYREKGPLGSVAIGCAEAFRLGQTATKTYQEIPDLATAFYRVYRNLQQPGRFLLLPAFYRITRYGGDRGDKAYRPIILVYAVLDAERLENTRILYEAMLAPDIPLLAYRELKRLLSAYAPEPILELPNTLAEKVTYQWDLSGSLAVTITVVRTPDCLDVSLATDVPSALLLKNVIQNTGISGEAQFTLHDGTQVNTTLSLDLNQITGPWASGGITIRRTGQIITLTNQIERHITVSDLYFYTGQNRPTRVAVERILAQGESLDITAPGHFDDAVADWSALNDNPVVLEEIRATVEDIRTNVVFVDLVNYENHGLSELQVEASLKGLAGTSRVPMQNRRGSVEFLLPITAYLPPRVVQYRVTKIFKDKPTETTLWLEWNIEANHNVVSLIWEYIA